MGVSDLREVDPMRKLWLPDVEVVVTFSSSTSATGVYENLISQLTKNCEEFEIKKAHLSRIESRELGVVAALRGYLMYKGQKVEFILEEEDTKYQGGQFSHVSDDYFPQQKILRLRLRCNNDLQSFINFYDVSLAKVVNMDEIERWVRCSSCDHSQSYFLVGDGFQLRKHKDMCSEGLHECDARLKGADKTNQSGRPVSDREAIVLVIFKSRLESHWT